MGAMTACGGVFGASSPSCCRSLACCPCRADLRGGRLPQWTTRRRCDGYRSRCTPTTRRWTCAGTSHGTRSTCPTTLCGATIRSVRPLRALTTRACRSARSILRCWRPMGSARETTAVTSLCGPYRPTTYHPATAQATITTKLYKGLDHVTWGSAFATITSGGTSWTGPLGVAPGGTIYVSATSTIPAEGVESGYAPYYTWAVPYVAPKTPTGIGITRQ